MIKRGLFIIALGIFLCFIINFVSSSVTINEVELNPAGTDNGYEWIELYSSDEINIIDWQIRSSNGRNMSFNASFRGYYLIKTKYNLLTNDKNLLSLYNGETLISSTKEFSDSYNDDRTWQYCSSEWKFIEKTKQEENNCSEIILEETPKEDNQENNVKDSSEKQLANDKKESTVMEESVVYEEVGNLSNDLYNKEKIIILTAREIDNSIVYKSKKEYIREYGLYALLALIVLFVLLLIKNKQNRKKYEEFE
jgi:hypothetical protein